MSRYDPPGWYTEPKYRAVPKFDHTGGWKESQYSAEMGRLICARVETGETLTSILADEGMPCRATLFRWLKMHEDFAEEYGRVRRERADGMISTDEGRAVARKWMREHEIKQGWRVRRGGGQRSTYTLCRGWAFCEAVAAGRTLAEIAQDPSLPSARCVYRWLKQRKEFRIMYERARGRQRFELELQIEAVVLGAGVGTTRAADAQVRYLEGRIGRLTPKKYRTKL